MGNGKAMGPVGVDSFGNNLNEVLDDATAKVKDVAEMGSEKLHAAKARFDGALKSAQVHALDAKRAAIARAKSGADTADAYVRHEPWKAVGIAAGAGVIAGLLLARR